MLYQIETIDRIIFKCINIESELEQIDKNTQQNAFVLRISTTLQYVQHQGVFSNVH